MEGTILIFLTIKQGRENGAKVPALSPLLSDSVTASLPRQSSSPCSGWSHPQLSVFCSPSGPSGPHTTCNPITQLAKALPLWSAQAGLQGHSSHVGSSVQMNPKILPSFTAISQRFILSPRGKHKPFCCH